MGGEGSLNHIENYALTGKVYMVGNGDTKEKLFSTFTEYRSRGRAVTKIKFAFTHSDDVAISRGYSHGTDGKIVWSIDERGDASIKTGKDAEKYLEYANQLHQSLSWKKSDSSISSAGKKTIDGEKMEHLVFSKENEQNVPIFSQLKAGCLSERNRYHLWVNSL